MSTDPQRPEPRKKPKDPLTALFVGTGFLALWLSGILVGGLWLAIVFSFLSVCGSLFFFYYVWRRSIHLRIFALLIGYIALMFCFATVHYGLYQWNHLNYHFTQSIQDERLFQDFDAQFKQVRTSNETLLYLAAVDDYLSEGLRAAQKMVEVEDAKKEEFYKSEDGFEPLGRGYTVRFSTSTRRQAREGGIKLPGREIVLEVKGNSERRIFGMYMACPVYESQAVADMAVAKDVDQFHAGLQQLIDGVRQERDQQMDHLEKLAQGSRWEFGDFCYFSTVTMTTVGYGDILPNSRMTRIVTMVQCIFGVFYLTFALTLLWPSGDSEKAGTAGTKSEKQP
jgi:hypothetical protein